MARDVAVSWLEEAGFNCDVAHSPSFPGGVDWKVVDPQSYSLVAFVCGPLGNGEPVSEFLDRFGGVRTIGLGLSMLHPIDEWNPFDLLLERDSTRAARPDLSFAHERPRPPVVGLVLAQKESEYPGVMQDATDEAIEHLVSSREMSIVRIDTCFDPENTGGLRTPGEVEALLSRMDAVITTRLHGLVLALKNGVPALAIDRVAGGAKIKKQAEAIGWPLVFTADRLDHGDLERALASCLTPDMRERASTCAREAIAATEDTRNRLLEWLATED